MATINNPAANGDLATGLLNATGLTKINLTGKTQLQVRLHTPTNGNGATHSMSFYSGENASSANRPKLIIVYR